MEVSNLDVTNQTVNEIESDAAQNDTNNESTVDTKCEQLPSDDNENVDSKLKDILKTSKTKNLMFKVSTNIAFKGIHFPTFKSKANIRRACDREG